VARLREAVRPWHETKGGSADHWLGLMAEEVKFRALAKVAGYLAGLVADWEMVYYTTHHYKAAAFYGFYNTATVLEAAREAWPGARQDPAQFLCIALNTFKFT